MPARHLHLRLGLFHRRRQQHHEVRTGISLTYAYKENYAWRLFLDYDYSRKTYTMDYNPGQYVLDALGWSNEDPDLVVNETQQIKRNRHTFILGGSFTISF